MVKTISIKVPDELYYELKRKMAELKCDKWLDFILKLSGIYPTTMEEASETVDVRKEIEEAVQSVDAQKERFKHVEVRRMGREALEKERKHETQQVQIEVRETRTGNCPFCGNVGTPILALHSQGWIHRLLVQCDCGEKYLVHLGKESLKKVDEFEEIKAKAPQCKLYPWDQFKKEYKIVKGIGGE